MNKNHVYREDWDNKKNMWIHSRLYEVGDNYYWYVREWRNKSKTPEFFNTTDDIERFLKDVAEHLKLWQVTRIRFYRAFDFYDHSQNEKKYYLLKSFFQQGDGFASDYNKDNWLGKEFTIKNTLTEKTNAGDSAKAIFDVLEEKWFIKDKRVDGDEFKFFDEHEGIAWGKIPVDRIMIPIQDKSTAKKRTLGLLAFDRRFNHIIDNEEIKESYSWLKAYSSMGEIQLNYISNDELNTMKGFLELVKNQLIKLRNKERYNQIRLWHEAISDGIENVFKNHQNNDLKPKEIIKELIEFLVKEWDCLDDYPIDRSKEKYQYKNSAVSAVSAVILNWYFLREEKSGALRGLGGYGELAKAREILFLNLEPFKTAFDSKNFNYILQDFKEWFDSYSNKIEFEKISKNIKNFKEEIEKVKAWIGIPITVLGYRYLMVVHASKVNYFTTHRSKLLKAFAIRITPFLLWLVADESRRWFGNALRHELKAPIDHIRQINKIPSLSKLVDIDNFLFFLNQLFKILK